MAAQISNAQISRTLKYVPMGLYFLVLLDVLLLLVPGLFGGLKVNGYVAVAIPVLALAFYSYIGYPVFTFNARDEVIRIRSHMAFSHFFGKELVVPKMNITHLAIDQSGIRRKLIVTYIKSGKEVQEKFSITILSDRKLKMLEAAIEDLEREKSPRNIHLFI